MKNLGEENDFQFHVFILISVFWINATNYIEEDLTFRKGNQFKTADYGKSNLKK